MIAGGSHGVHGAVKDAREANINNVFGIVDRDFGTSNEPRWDQLQTYTFVILSHEIENYLLEPDALASAPFNVTRLDSTTLAGEIFNKAKEQVWWYACCRTIALIQSKLNEDFPKHPKIPTMTALEHVQSYLAQDTWLGSLSERAREFNSSWIDEHLQQFGHEAEGALQDSSWKQLFAGKQILKHVCSRIPRGQNRSTRDIESDVAKHVGAWQRSNNRVPDELMRLNQALNKRLA